MAGHHSESQLGSRVRFALATPEDNEGIRQLLRENPMRGAISLSFEREPDYFADSQLAETRTIVATANAQIVCVGRHSQRNLWLNGQPQPVGYLGELRLAAAFQGRFDFLRRGYQFFKQLQRSLPFCFTSIATDNLRARRFLEYGLKGLPRYTFLSDFTTLLISVPRRPAASSLHTTPCQPEHTEDLLTLLNDHGKNRQLATAWSGISKLPGLALENFLLALIDGRLVAAAALWDQRSFRQTVIRGYSPLLTAARPLLNFASRFNLTPRLPPVGALLNSAFLSPLAFLKNHESILPEFIQAFFPHAARLGVEYLCLGLPSTDPRLGGLRRRFSTRSYQSRLYSVHWGDQPPAFDSHSFLPDIAFL